MPFHLRFRKHQGREDVIEVFIACTRCTFDQVLRLSTQAGEQKRKKRARVRARIRYQERRDGQATNELYRLLGVLDVEIGREDEKAAKACAA